MTVKFANENFTIDEKDERLIRSIVRKVMRKFDSIGLDENDLFQEGRIALWKAVTHYEGNKGAKFETFASTVIYNRIVDVIRTHKEILTVNTEPMPVLKNGEDGTTSELFKILDEVLEVCSEFEKAIFNAYFQGYSYQEICKIFSVNKKKVDNTIQKIHRLARSIYKD